MRAYIIRRLLFSIPAVLMTLILIFLMLRILPGDVAETMLLGGASGNAGMIIPKEVHDALVKDLGLDKPIPVQLAQFIWGVVRGDLGKSLYSNETVWNYIGQRAPITLQISIMALFLGLFFGIPIGVITAIKQDSLPDYVLRFFSIMFLAIPSFWLGLVVLLVGATLFNWMPPVGRNVFWEGPLESLRQSIWPSLILASHSTAVIARMTRSTMLEVLREDYIRTARAKGLAEQVVIVRHALKNALIPVVTIAGLAFGGLLAGTVILERVFTIPGMGTLFINSITRRDYPIIQGIVLVIAISFVFVNLIVDLLYGWLDPRISYGSG
ncbi:MAG: ABC transporter permease [Dehalococcoidia bacterium]|nr:ABC transporter permease [Dehalococcoidia bacterium]